MADVKEVRIVGGGLAGCEAAWQLAERGIPVVLVEQKPLARTPAQNSDALCELVCSNSFRGAALMNAVGLLKEEMRRAGSLIMGAAEIAKVPAGGALAVDREVFSAEITRRIDGHALIRRESAIVDKVPEASAATPVILATGPLTGDALAADLARIVGADHLAYYDAIAPIISADSIDWSRVFKQSRYGKGETPETRAAAASEAADTTDADDALAGNADGVGGDDAYVNCPFDEAGYRAFVAELVAAEKVKPRAFEEPKYFEGCLPVEVMASRGEMTLSFGPMKPVGLYDPKTGKRPYAVVQLRQEDAAATAYNLVGFQTRMTYGEQARVLRTIPGLENAEFLRFGNVHRNTFVNSPELLDETMQLKAQAHVYLAGQISGVEGYVESAAGGLLCAMMLAQRVHGHPLTPPPENTALGGLRTHLARKDPNPKVTFQPSNITWACLPPHENRKLKKRERYTALAERALVEMDRWLATAPLAKINGLTAPATPPDPG